LVGNGLDAEREGSGTLGASVKLAAHSSATA